MSQSNYKKFIDSNSERFLNELLDFLRIPSVSADPSHKTDVQNCAKWVADSMKSIGLEDVNIFPTEGHPIVFGEVKVGEELPTVLVYGHYDVQPPDPLNLWESEPFNPVIKEGKVVARGAADDKGQVYMHFKAVETLKQSGTLPCNVKFLIEGEEEVGSDHLEEFVRSNQDLLSCDTILISDTSMLSEDVPSITTGLKGLSYIEVEITGPNRDLHSGIYGGAVANPINILCKMIASLQDENGRITIPEFYDNVREYSAEEREEIARAPFSEDAYKRHLEIDATFGEEGYTTLERTGIRPTIDVNGIWGGYIGEGAKTVLPSKAYAKISMRLVPNQTCHEITDKFEKHFKAIAPKSVRVKVTPHHGGDPALTDITSNGYQAASDAMEKVWRQKPVPVKAGGSIPIVALFQEVLKKQVILLGFGLDEDAIHSPNESYRLAHFYKGIETICEFHSAFRKLN